MEIKFLKKTYLAIKISISKTLRKKREKKREIELNLSILQSFLANALKIERVLNSGEYILT